MKRLKAVMNPVGPARRPVRMAALGLGLGLAAAAAVASVAVAGQRAEILRPATSAQPVSGFAARLSNASAADFRLFCAAAEGSMDRMACSMLLWDAADSERSAAIPAFCAPDRSDADLELIAERGRAVTLTSPAARGSAQDGARRAMIAAFPCGAEPRTVPAATVARAADALGAAWEQQHGARAREETAAREAADAATTGADFQRMCANRDARDDGYCAGVLFGVAIAEARSATPAFCAPEFEGREATGRFVDAAKAGVAEIQVAAGQSPGEVARAGLARAYPCRAAERASNGVIVSPPARQDGTDSVLAVRDRSRATPAEAVEIARIETDEVVRNGQAPRMTGAPAQPAESAFLAARRAEREAARRAWPTERGLLLPGWPRPNSPARGSPFYYERRAT